MAHFTPPPDAFGSTEFSSSAAASHPLGTIATTRDGRIFRYVQAGAADLVVGNVIQSPAQIANHQQLTPAVAALGATQITVALGATLASLNQYAGGLAIIDTTPGLGFGYTIKGHPAAALSTNLVLTLEDSDGIQVALTASSRVSLQAHPYSGVIQAPVTTLTGAVVGVAVNVITAAQFGWIQTHGHCGVLINGTPAVGQSVSSPGTVAGAASINSGTLAILGTMLVTGVDTKVQAVFLMVE